MTAAQKERRRERNKERRQQQRRAAGVPVKPQPLAMETLICVYVAHHVHGQTAPDIARAMGLKYGTVWCFLRGKRHQRVLAVLDDMHARGRLTDDWASSFSAWSNQRDHAPMQANRKREH